MPVIIKKPKPRPGILKHVRRNLSGTKRDTLRQRYGFFDKIEKELSRLESAVGFSTSKNLLKKNKFFFATFPEITVGEFKIGITPAMYESTLALSIYPRTEKAKDFLFRGIPAFSIKLGLEGDSVIVEAIQGPKKNPEFVREAKEALRKPLANALLEILEKHARMHGYKRVKIRNPEELAYYQNPVLDSAKEPDPKTVQKISKRVARIMKFGKKSFVPLKKDEISAFDTRVRLTYLGNVIDNGRVSPEKFTEFMEKLKNKFRELAKKPRDEKDLEKDAETAIRKELLITFMRRDQISRIQKAIKNLYANAARGSGYTMDERKHFYVKELEKKNTA